MSINTSASWSEYVLIYNSDMRNTNRYRTAYAAAFEDARDGETDTEWADRFFTAWDAYFQI